MENLYCPGSVCEAKLPRDFLEKMKRLLGEEYGSFIRSYERKRTPSLRINTLKVSKEDFERISPFRLRPVPWAETGFFYEEEDRPGKHPYHEAGLYYIQESSAMAVGALAKPKLGERVLDLCAAPGGKTTQLAAYMQGRGLLVSNEIHPARAKILSSNVERMGIANALVTNEKPENLAKHFPEFFDRIIVDAPCSGEGMFRKEEQALLHWSQENVELCAARQQDILQEAAKMLHPGGVLLYSTCTFSPEENEGSIGVFLSTHPEFSILSLWAYEGFAPGRSDWAPQNLNFEIREKLSDTFRLWPHRLEGEGHYVAVLKKSGEAREISQEELPEAGGRLSEAERKAWKLYEEFATQTLREKPQGFPLLFGDQLYLSPYPWSLKGLRTLRPGLHLGTIKKNRFEPSHALALYLKADQVKQKVELSVESGWTEAYLRGEALAVSGEKGWSLVLTKGFSLGWGKQTGNMLKNHYPKGKRGEFIMKEKLTIGEQSLKLHEKWKGKIKIQSRVPVKTSEDLSLAYTPGVAQPCLEIQKDVDKSYVYTNRWNSCLVVTDGTAVLGLGDIGPEAGMPVMEGKCVLFKEFGNVDAYPLCIKSKDVDEIVRTIYLISGSFGGVNLEDISAPRCFEIEKQLKEKCDIPIFHDDQHGTAVITLAGITNALRLVGKKKEEISLVINGAGAAAISIARLLLAAGIKDVTLCDRTGAIYEGREKGMNPMKEEMAKLTNLKKVRGGLADIIKGADVFIGVSAPGSLTTDMVRTMAKDAVIFACANPTPEIYPEEAKAGGARVVATGRSDYPNQINNVLAFPGIFRGAFDVRARDINDEMKLAAAKALADLISDEELSEDYIIPAAFDPRVGAAVAQAVAKAARDSGVARI